MFHGNYPKPVDDHDVYRVRSDAFQDQDRLLDLFSFGPKLVEHFVDVLAILASTLARCWTTPGDTAIYSVLSTFAG